MVTKKNENLLKALLLSLISISLLVSVYYLNTANEKETEDENSYLKSEICYYALNGIVADHHYHLQLNITILDERIEIPMNVGFERDSEGNTIFLHPIHNVNRHETFEWLFTLKARLRSVSFSRTYFRRFSPFLLLTPEKVCSQSGWIGNRFLSI